MIKTLTQHLSIQILKLVIFLLTLCFSINLSAVQLLNQLPTELKNNWQVCKHFESQQAQCIQTSLPLQNWQPDKNLTQQTFINHIVVSSNLKNETLGLWIEDIDDVDEVHFNHQLIGKTGQFLPNYETGFRLPRLYLIPSEIIQFNYPNKIEIKTFSSRNSPGIKINSPSIVGYLTKLHQLQQRDYSFVISATVLLLLSLFQIFYFVVIKDRKETFYCAIFLIAFAIISISRSQIPLDIGLNLSSAFKLESFMLNVAIISVILFTFHFFELEVKNYFSFGLILLGISALIIILWPSAIDLRLISEINYLLIILITFLVLGSALIIAINKRRDYVWVMSSTIVIGWLILIFDAIMHSSELLQITLVMRKEIVPLCAALVGIVFTLTVTHKYWQLIKGATYDQLTGTLLRSAFFQRLSEEMQRCQRGDNQLIVAVIDIQQVTEISANFGYNIGNQLLITVSNSLTKTLRPFDLICRISEDQFCFAATIQHQENAESCLKRVYQGLVKIQQPLQNNIQLNLDTRVGGIIYNHEQHLSVSQLLQDANYALSKAKSLPLHNYLLIQDPIITA